LGIGSRVPIVISRLKRHPTGTCPSHHQTCFPPLLLGRGPKPRHMSGQARPYSAAGGHHASASLSWTISGMMRVDEQTETSSSCRQSRRASAAEQAIRKEIRDGCYAECALRASAFSVLLVGSIDGPHSSSKRKRLDLLLLQLDNYEVCTLNEQRVRCKLSFYVNSVQTTNKSQKKFKKL
jgi:hypothetical protein